MKVLNVIANVCTRLLGVDPADEVSNVHTAGELGSMLAASRQEGSDRRDRARPAVGCARLRRAQRRRGDGPARAHRVGRGKPRRWRTRRPSSSPAATRASSCAAPTSTTSSASCMPRILLTVPAGARRRPIPIARIRRVLVLPPDRPLDDVLRDMRRTRTHVGRRASTRAAPLGLLTLEDVLEDARRRHPRRDRSRSTTADHRRAGGCARERGAGDLRPRRSAARRSKPCAASPAARRAETWSFSGRRGSGSSCSASVPGAGASAGGWPARPR